MYSQEEEARNNNGGGNTASKRHKNISTRAGTNSIRSRRAK